LALIVAAAVAAQTPEPAGPPWVVAFNGVVLGDNGQPRVGAVSLTFSLYKEQTDVVPIWSETQTVQLDTNGRYYVWLGQHAALPLELFQNSDARWLGVTPAGLAEQARVRLLSVPYALKSGDAETLGGLPASAFLKAGATQPSIPTRLLGQTSRAFTQTIQSDSGVLDNVIADDQIVVGRLCAGVDCVNGEVFDDDGEIRIKANNTRIKFVDTSTALGFPDHDWRITVNDSISGGLNYFGIEDLTTSAKYYMHSDDTPGDWLHISVLDTPGIKLEQNNIFYPAYSWSVRANNTLFRVFDETAGTIPFRIEAAAPTKTLYLSNDLKVGIGTATPPHALSIRQTPSSYVNLISTAGNAGHIFTAGSKEAVIRLNIADGSFSWENPNGTERMRITQSGNVGIGTTTPTNPLQMGSGAFVSAGGVWTNASSRTLKDQIANLPASQALQAFARLQPVTFSYKAEPNQTHVGFISEDVPDLVATADRKSLSPMDIVAVVTKVVQEQQATIAEQQAAISDLKARLARLEALLAAMGGSK
jgi:hypothetical protein